MEDEDDGANGELGLKRMGRRCEEGLVLRELNRVEMGKRRGVGSIVGKRKEVGEKEKVYKMAMGGFVEEKLRELKGCGSAAP